MTRKRRPTPHHWKLMAWIVGIMLVGGVVAVVFSRMVAGIVVLLGLAMVLLQWFLINPPEVDQKDLH